MNFWIRLLMVTNVFLFRLTGGFLGSRMAGQNVLLLHSTGRKSGKAYITPTNYYNDGENYVLVASNWGKDRHPAWFYNLMHQQTATIQVKDKLILVRPRQASLAEYDRLWALVSSQNAYYVRYQAQTGRKIPVVILTPYIPPPDHLDGSIHKNKAEAEAAEEQEHRK
jgi:deazaflavin-dependent oxidoreductase (nitroreductase family)